MGRAGSRWQGCVTRRLRTVTKIFKNMYLSGRTTARPVPVPVPPRGPSLPRCLAAIPAAVPRVRLRARMYVSTDASYPREAGYIFISRFLPACEPRGALEGVLAAYPSSLRAIQRNPFPSAADALRSQSEDNAVIASPGGGSTLFRRVSSRRSASAARSRDPTESFSLRRVTSSPLITRPSLARHTSRDYRRVAM